MPGAGRTSSEVHRAQGRGPGLAQVLTVVGFVHCTEVICYSFYKLVFKPET